LQAAGYQLVTVADCLGAQPYNAVGAPYARDVSRNPSICGGHSFFKLKATWTCGDT